MYVTGSCPRFVRAGGGGGLARTYSHILGDICCVVRHTVYTRVYVALFIPKNRLQIRFCCIHG